MLTKRRLFFAALMGVVVLSGFGRAADDKKKDDAGKCPVSGKAASKEHAVDYKGGKVYFCCDMCPEAFKKSPEKFATKAIHQMLQTGEAIEVACPLTGKPLNKETAIDVDGVKVAFCCMNCKAKAEKADDKYALLFKPDSIDKAYTTQTECPVSGKKIDPDKFVEYKGHKVYFCCENCPKEFEKDPKKFEDKLPKFDEEKK